MTVRPACTLHTPGRDSAIHQQTSQSHKLLVPGPQPLLTAAYRFTAARRQYAKAFSKAHRRTCIGETAPPRLSPTVPTRLFQTSPNRGLFVPRARQERDGPMLPDESESVVLLVACAVGLLTGGGVVLFNVGVHYIRQLVWSHAPHETANWTSWARALPPSEWYLLIFPPVVGGIVVGAMKSLSGGLSTAPALDPFLMRAAVKNAAPKASILSTVRSILSSQSGQGSASSSSGQRRQDAEPTARSVQSGEAAYLEMPDGSTTAGSSPAVDDTLSAMAKQQRQSGQYDPGPPSTSEKPDSPLAPVLRALAAAITLGSGNSLGPEGPSVDIGRSTAEALAGLLRSKKRRLTPLLAAGAGAGVAAGFNAPISGVFFAVETVLQKRGNKSTGDNSEGVTIAAVLLACLVSSIASQAGLGAVPAFRIPSYRLQSVYEMPLVLLLGALAGIVSSAFLYSSQASDFAFKRLKQLGTQPLFLPAVGGLVTGLTALAYPEVLYEGFGNVDAVLDVHGQTYSAWLLSQIVIAKVFATAVCRGSGLVGGLYAPSIFTGAALGSAFGAVAQQVGAATGYGVVEPQAYALVGVAAMLAGTCQVPLTAVLLLFELTHDYNIILPTLGAVGLAYWIASLPTTAAALQQLLPGDADAQLTPPSSTPLQTTADPDFVTGQLNLGIAKDNTEETTSVRSAPQTRVISKIDQLKRRLPFAGAKAASQEDAIADCAALNGASQAAASNGANGTRRVETLTPEQEDDQGLTVQCALEGNCVLLRRDTLLSEALSLLDEEEQAVALVVDDVGAVAGLLTRESIVQAMSDAVDGARSSAKLEKLVRE